MKVQWALSQRGYYDGPIDRSDRPGRHTRNSSVPRGTGLAGDRTD
jgi:hypothetical protein